jgi:hypothetical protein
MRRDPDRPPGGCCPARVELPDEAAVMKRKSRTVYHYQANAP